MSSMGSIEGMSMNRLTEEQVRKLAECLRAAYREECESGECQCITVEEHERRLAYQPTTKGAKS